MEAVVAQYSAEHHRQSLSVSPYKNKQIRSPRNRPHHHSVNLAAAPRLLPHESFGPMGSGVGGGWPSNSQKQPPLLPLPVTPKAHVSSHPPPPSSANPKQPPQRLARHGSLNPTSKPLIRRQGSVVVPGRGADRGGSGPLGPHPDELPRDMSISKVPTFSVKPGPLGSGRLLDSVFELAPPPSSLPLPKFSLRPKLGCNAEAGVDSGATDGLRRILRLP